MYSILNLKSLLFLALAGLVASCSSSAQAQIINVPFNIEKSGFSLISGVNAEANANSNAHEALEALKTFLVDIGGAEIVDVEITSDALSSPAAFGFFGWSAKWRITGNIEVVNLDLSILAIVIFWGT